MKPKSNDVYAFIDSQNLNLGVQRVGWKMDWRKFRAYLAKEHGVTQAYMFIGYMHENEAMYNQLHELGYLIVLKPTIEMNIPPESADKTKPASETAEPPKPIIKGNIDAELVLYAMKELPNYQKAIIVSGDGDFYCLAEYLAGEGKLAHILTPNYKYSSLLKPYEKYIIRIDQLRRQLEHKDFRKKLRLNKPKTT
jgi:uncharacterized LabA/DUF88 family protein